jgi:hypothetical protein
MTLAGAMPNPDVPFRRILAVRLAVRAAAELTVFLIRSQEATHERQRQAGELSDLDRAMFALGAAAATVGAVQLGIVARWIATGKGPGVVALITFV